MSASPFALPEDLAGKATPALINTDQRHFTAIAANIERARALAEEQLTSLRLAPGGTGQEAMDRDLEIHRTVARLRALRRNRLDLCLGRMVTAINPDVPIYVGRFGMHDARGSQLLVDWRAPDARPFFAATAAQPMGLFSRRRYRWSEGTVIDYWDEVLAPSPTTQALALDDDSAFVASLGVSRTNRMRDALATLQADQDLIIRASSRGPLVVDGGPGTGKTVVALHRAAYLLHAENRLRQGSGRLLIVGPHHPFLSYISDVLPSFGEEGVQSCTIRDLVPWDCTPQQEEDQAVARLKATVAMVNAIEPAVLLYEEPPTYEFEVETPWSDLRIGAAEWAEAFGAADPATPHNEARDAVRDALVEILLDQHDHEETDRDERLRDERRRYLRNHSGIEEELGKSWPRINPIDLVGDLWEVPAYLQMCAPWLTPVEVRRLKRSRPHGWTVSDLPLLDAARLRLGDPGAGRRRRQQDAAQEAEREEMSRVVDHLIASDDSNMKIMSMLRGQDLRDALVTKADRPNSNSDLLAGPFAHIVVDEAQELTDAEWQMLVVRCPSHRLVRLLDVLEAVSPERVLGHPYDVVFQAMQAAVHSSLLATT
ncbi:RNA polymerase recycling motor ATPase HelR [Williamsia sp. 1135]|uniref:RNA polymerase recycling motor ATPase HelR n=1 Tax=Williamsia sp. 1135 TaxID=1889262 RepID=UPI000A0F74AD|nr:RNA polymerase recycling motor ATPase HelR [Williamsia sp. 1135]ORM27804.1 hypothetical protein BFL43_22185 [Williamsia sp. 1135]